ncbi:hypothetical protein HUG20_15005 [Salicibibacter cibi]|uniref:Uncharacterized protein n=1 Tax=Salicibibacter cibi TaxID=2743001 RepID=A0A7T6ZCP2_9BACI|nr:hypothetical protein [Salicibibacter cibi]QQK81076.1 hypothetical protein HUG20_15005 [Salicibibacter cibi]
MKENESISWHPSFAAALQLELQAYADELEFQLEFELTSEPLKVDVLILKDGEAYIDKNIGRIFRHYNVVEYKSPRDYVSIDDFYKAIAYVYLYKNTGDKGIDTIDIREMTLTLVSLYKPTKLLDHLQKREKHVYFENEGVYYIEGMDVPIQLLIQEDLPNKENEYLTLLTNQLQEKEQLQRALMDYFQDSKKDLYLLMFHAVFHANPELFTEVIQTMQKLDLDPDTQKKIDDVVKEFEWDKKWREEGSELAKEEIAKKLFVKGMSLEDIAEATGLSIDKINKLTHHD